MSDQNQSAAVGENVVQRLRMRIREARAMGFQVRQELLGDQPAAWCEIGGRKVLFIDAAQPAREQIATIEEAIASYRPAQ
jgi:hypothetical protein